MMFIVAPCSNGSVVVRHGGVRDKCAAGFGSDGVGDPEAATLASPSSCKVTLIKCEKYLVNRLYLVLHAYIPEHFSGPTGFRPGKKTIIMSG
jgi:hypothetical protein